MNQFVVVIHIYFFLICILIFFFTRNTRAYIFKIFVFFTKKKTFYEEDYS